ncbi:hypothetical protein NSU_2436 [Novosphingobium pentaromativorans US6-1]|uniref:Uncharacterized protein n=1 Tax=Novosphingobium pentaromativorans US6-1 TaxID=1088721 RepID=G6EDL5_9SPHN|nr:hypothetical protein NSU_2436 [Novosphingobium pentaromativorans US6-1]
MARCSGLRSIHRFTRGPYRCGSSIMSMTQRDACRSILRVRENQDPMLIARSDAGQHVRLL